MVKAMAHADPAAAVIVTGGGDVVAAVRKADLGYEGKSQTRGRNFFRQSRQRIDRLVIFSRFLLPAFLAILLFFFLCLMFLSLVCPSSPSAAVLVVLLACMFLLIPSSLPPTSLCFALASSSPSEPSKRSMPLLLRVLVLNHPHLHLHLARCRPLHRLHPPCPPPRPHCLLCLLRHPRLPPLLRVTLSVSPHTSSQQQTPMS